MSAARAARILPRGRTLRIGCAALVGYLAGTLPSADLAARAATGGSMDLRKSGSGNPGGANTRAVLGSGWGYLVMAADIAKAAVACRVGRRLAGDPGQHAAGTASVIGHCYPAWSGFSGGKGVACSVGQCVATFPAYFPIDVAVASAVAARPRRQRAYTATTVASATWVASAFMWWRRGWPNAWGGRPSAGLPLSAALSSAVILRRFRAGTVAR